MVIITARSCDSRLTFFRIGSRAFVRHFGSRHELLALHMLNAHIHSDVRCPRLIVFQGVLPSDAPSSPCRTPASTDCLSTHFLRSCRLWTVCVVSATIISAAMLRPSRIVGQMDGRPGTDVPRHIESTHLANLEY